MLHQINAPQFYTDLGLQKTVLNPLAISIIQGLFKAFECFKVLFKANFIFKDFARQSCIFKYFSSLCKPCLDQTATQAQDLPTMSFLDETECHSIVISSNYYAC